MITHKIYKHLKGVMRRTSHAMNASRVSLDQIKDNLSVLPPLKGRILFAHSGLKSLGYVERGAQGFTETLCEYVLDQGGTLAMPAFTMQGSMTSTLRSQDWIFDVMKTPSHMGAISECFRCMPGVERSLHPTHSVCALGEKARWLTEDHHTDVKAFGSVSPLGKLLQDNGVYAGMGVSIRPFTFAHVVEDMISDFPLNVYTADSPISCKVYDKTGANLTVKSNALEKEAYKIRIDHPQAQALREVWAAVFRAEADLTYAPLGSGEMWFFPEVQKCYDTMLRQARVNRFTIYSEENSIFFKNVHSTYMKKKHFYE